MSAFLIRKEKITKLHCTENTQEFRETLHLLVN